VILVDDLRIYEDGPVETGNTPERAQTLPPERRNIDLVTRGPIAATHDVQRFHPRTGYLVLTPKRTG